MCQLINVKTITKRFVLTRLRQGRENITSANARTFKKHIKLSGTVKRHVCTKGLESIIYNTNASEFNRTVNYH